MMRKIKRTILVILMTAIMLNINAQEKRTYDWTKVMNTIIQVESKGNAKAFNKNGNCAGILQITPSLVKQVNIWLANKGSSKRYTLSDRFNAQKSKEMFIMFQEHCNPSHNVEKAIRMWNGGPNGHKNPKTLGYYRKVMKYYNGGK